MKKRNLLVLIFALILCACFIGCGGCGEIDPINIEDDNITIKRIGDTYQLTTTGGDDNKVWSCLDTSVATVSETGLVTAVANGITEVTVTSANVTDVCVINVKQAILPEPGLMVSFAKSAVVLNGFSKETYTVETIVTKNNQEIEADLTWTNSDTDGEYITFENGVITAKANTPLGKPVVITCRATYGEEWAEASLYVTVEDDTDITFLTSETLFYYAPEAPENITIPVTAKINGMDATEPIVLSTSNEGIAKIEGDEIKLVAAGDVTIYATVNNKTKGYAIHIRAKYFVDTVDELKAISQGSDDVAYELRNDITVEIPDFTREDIGGTGTKTVAVYLVDKFKGELFGKGYKITYNYNSGYYGDFTEETFRGLFKTVEPTALIKDTVFVANLRLDHPHMYSFIYQNYGRVESCFVYSNRRQVAVGTGYQNHYNTAGGVFERNDGVVTDTIIVGNFFKDEHGTTSIGDNLVMAGSKNAGKFDNVAFVSARTAIGNHRNANWDGNGAMGRDELTYLVRYDDMNAFANKEGERVTNPNDTSDYSQDLYVRTECTDQELSTKWEIGAENIKLENKDAWIKASVETNVNTLDFIPGEAETATVTATSDHSSQEFEFKSEDTDVAVVDANGIVSKIGIGRTRIIATHKVSGEQKAVLVAVLKKVDVTSKEEFLALKDADNTTYASLTTDINLDMDDVVRTADVTVANEVFIPNLKAYIDGNGHTVNISYTSHELDVEQEVQIEGEEEGVTETIIVKKDSNFTGLFGTVASTANIRNLSIQGFIDNIRDGATILASSLSSGAKVQNCFINVETYQSQSGKWNEDEQTWKNQYWSQALKVISSNYGAIENSIIQVNNRHGNSVAGVPLQSHWTGTWTNVAQVGITHGGAWYNFGGQKKINANQLDNVVHYTDLQNIAGGVGRDWTVENGSYSFTNITGVQDFGSAWTISADEIKLKGESVWKNAEVTTDVSEIVLIEGRDTTANITALVDGADNENIVFVSSNEDVVTVSSAGVVTAVGKGIAKVRAVYAGNIATVTVKVLESRAIATKEEFLALGELDSAVYAYLTNDIILTTEDAIRLSNTTANESFIANFASNLDGNGYKIVATYTSRKVNVEETVDVEGTPTVQTVEKDSNFHGIFKSVSGSITGLNVELTVNGGFDGGALFAYELTAEGTLTDSFVRANVTMTASGSGNWYSTWGIIKSNYGRIESSIVSANGHGNRSVPLQTHQSGKWVNVAYVASDKAGGYSNQGAGKLLNTDQLVNVAYYKSFADLVSGKGESWTSTGTAKGSFVYTALTNAQDLGSAWVISNAEFNESIKLNGNVVWQTDVIEVTDKADFIAKMNSATDSTVLRLTQDLSFTSNDFTREDNGSTGVRNKDVYLIKSFKGTLFGNGKKITWELIPENVSNKDLCDSSVKGLIYNLESTAKLIGCNFQGVTHVPYDSATAFIENV
ncbi:MAG: Ig-like domain-containing protein, partial [Clostridia bacterium]|nr:Ig-like domain-containing protein [Clostridia bacterium]